MNIVFADSMDMIDRTLKLIQVPAHYWRATSFQEARRIVECFVYRPSFIIVSRWLANQLWTGFYDWLAVEQYPRNRFILYSSDDSKDALNQWKARQCRLAPHFSDLKWCLEHPNGVVLYD